MMQAKLLLIVCCLLVGTTVSAETFVRTGDQYELSKEQTIEGNFLGIGTPISVSGEVDQDVTLLGNQVIVTGYVGGDLLTASVLSQLGGVVEGDVRVVGADVTLSGVVNGDVLVFAGSVDVLSGATVTGDIVLYTGSANIAGEVGGNVLGSSRTVVIDGMISGSVDVRTNQLELGSSAAVTESVRYTSENLLNQAANASVGESIVRNDPVVSGSGSSVGSPLLSSLMVLFATMMWFFLSKRSLQMVAAQAVTTPLRSFVTGLVVLLLVPVAILVLSLSVVGTYVAVLLAVLAVAFVLLSVAAVPALVGYGCVKISNIQLKEGDEGFGLLVPVVGLVLCVLLSLLPIVGIIVLLSIAVLVLGGLIDVVVRSVK